jgi:hypothetical protein
MEDGTEIIAQFRRRSRRIAHPLRDPEESVGLARHGRCTGDNKLDHNRLGPLILLVLPACRYIASAAAPIAGKGSYARQPGFANHRAVVSTLSHSGEPSPRIFA